MEKSSELLKSTKTKADQVTDPQTSPDQAWEEIPTRGETMETEVERESTQTNKSTD